MKHTAYKIQLPAGPMVNRRISYDTPRPIQCPRFDTSAEKKDDNPAFTLVNTNTRQPQIGYSPAGINPQKPAPKKLGTEAQHFASVCAFCFFYDALRPNRPVGLDSRLVGAGILRNVFTGFRMAR